MSAWRRWCAAGVLIGPLTSGCAGSSDPGSTSAEAAPSPPATSSATAAQPTAEVETASDVLITGPVPCNAGECEIPADVIAPVGAEGLPTIVLLPGGPIAFGERRYLTDFGSWLAARGAVVFLTTYRSSVTGNSAEESTFDVRCAVRFARAHAGEYGGDADHVTLVGHSFGSQLAIEAAVNPDTQSPGCLAEGNGVPDAVVGLAGFNVSLEGASDSGPPVLLMSGSVDPASVQGDGLADALRDAGFEADYVELDNVSHEGIITPERAPAVVDSIFDLAAASAN